MLCEPMILKYNTISGVTIKPVIKPGPKVGVSIKITLRPKFAFSSHFQRREATVTQIWYTLTVPQKPSKSTLALTKK